MGFLQLQCTHNNDLIMGYQCSIDEFYATVGLSRSMGGVGEVCKVSCTYRCSDHCSGLQQVRGPGWSSPAKSLTSSYVRHATTPWQRLGR